MTLKPLALAALLAALPAATLTAPAAIAQEYKAGAIEITKPWARATPAGAKNGAAFVTLTSLNWADELIGASSPAAEKVEFHQTSEENGIARMRAVPEIAIPAGDTVTLAPGGTHIMLMGLKAPLAEGERVAMTLTFRKGRTVDIKLPVKAAGAGHDHGNMNHGAQ